MRFFSPYALLNETRNRMIPQNAGPEINFNSPFKTVATFVVLGVFLGTGAVLPSANAAPSVAPKPGASCAKVNAVVKVQKITLRCELRRGKKIWVKVTDTQGKKPVTKVPAPKPSSTPTPAGTPNDGPSGSPTPLPTPERSTPAEPTKNPVQVELNPVRATIGKRIQDLKVPDRTQAPAIQWSVGEGVPDQALESMRRHHQELADTYPDSYKWPGTAKAIISTDVQWIKDQLLPLNCPANYLQFVETLLQRRNGPGAGTSYCSGQYVGFFWYNGFSDRHWELIMGQEFGSRIQENATREGTSEPTGQTYPGTEIPEWYLQGGQDILSMIAAAATSRNWPDLSTVRLLEGGDYCRGRTLEFEDCIYVTGPVAVELAVALYGWDAPTRLMSANRATSAAVKVPFAEGFRRAFGDSYDVFARYASAYLRYLESGVELPADLLQRLSRP